MVKSKYGTIKENAQQQIDCASKRLQGAKQNLDRCQKQLQKAQEREISSSTSHRHYHSATVIEREISDWEQKHAKYLLQVNQKTLEAQKAQKELNNSLDILHEADEDLGDAEEGMNYEDSDLGSVILVQPRDCTPAYLD
ncbi:hypothetical protein L873DRAFT_1789338 [Choiromyces venosus 120613-1]|uniref:Uncharacterized protein n=1 Tax=Choiromyces venosus 120613-1 TaxID=1336337 RepID=A0A3N4JSB1_9PEZI|nr:hypothetical protein L873DRAFT_1789338 [Choiromyces venosus 120613-1]